MEASEPIAVFGPAADHRQGAACVQRRMPAGYPLEIRLNETDAASTVTAYQRLPALSFIGSEAYRWQVRLTPKATELRTNISGWDEPFADRPVYDAIAACGFKR